MNAIIEIARAYLLLGWMAIPIPSRTKIPTLPEWQDLRLGEADLPRYFQNGCNIGLLLGAPSGGLVDVDCDAPEAVMLAPHFLPQTLRIHGRPGKPRSHYWCYSDVPTTEQYRAPDGTMIVELRSTGGQTVVPPSTHPSGEQLAWEAEGAPARVPPERLRAAVATLAAAALLARHWPAAGGRHDAANALAGMLLRAGWSCTDVQVFVERIAEAAGDEEAHKRTKDAASTAKRLAAGGKATGAPTLATLVGDDVVAKACEWLGLPIGGSGGNGGGAGAPWEPPAPFHTLDLPPLPGDALAGWLEAWARAEAGDTQTPLDLAALLALAAVAVAVAKRFEVEVKPNWREPLNIYVTVALPPGERKSAVFRDATRPLEDHERDEAARVAPEIEAAKAVHRIAQKAARKAEERAAKAHGSPEFEALQAEAKDLARRLAATKVPAPPRLFADDATPEALATLIRDQGGRLAIMSAEGGIFDLMAGRYSEGSPNFEVYLKAHPGDPLRVDRVNRPREHVRRPALTVGLAVQPEVIRGLACKPGFRGRGLPMPRRWP